MEKNRLFTCLVLLSFALVVGCSGGSSGFSSGGSGTSQISLTMIDTPPSSVAIVSFEVNVTGATLNPGGPDLLAGKPPVEIEVKRLEVETAFISTANVTADSTKSFTSLTLTFANPELTFQNITNAPITFGTCVNVPPQGVCELKPATASLTAMSVPLPAALTITANNPIGLKVDVKLDNLISNTLSVDFSTPGAVTVAQSQLKAEGELEDVDDVFGTVQNKNTTVTPNTFDLKPSEGNPIIGIQVNSSTQLEGFTCPAPQTFAACVQNGDMVEVDIDLLPGGVLLAKKIEKENEAANEEDIEGIVFSVNIANNALQMVAVENTSSLSVSVLGSPVTISIQIGANFQVDTDGLNVSSTLVNSFNDINALQPGQNVQVRRLSGDGTTTPIVTDRVRLRKSRFTATVSQAPSGGNFNVAPLSGTLLAAAGVTTILVQTTTGQTEFEGVSGVTGLSVGDTVSLRGLLFKGPPVTLVAGKVRKR